MIEITNEMKKHRAERLAYVERKVDKQIEFANELGQNRRLFDCSKDGDADVYDEIREKYEKAGYKIVPTGYSGGVWQKTEDICW